MCEHNERRTAGSRGFPGHRQDNAMPLSRAPTVTVMTGGCRESTDAGMDFCEPWLYAQPLPERLWPRARDRELKRLLHRLEDGEPHQTPGAI